MDWITELLRNDWMPHSFCIRNTPWLLWSRVISDSIIALSYYVTPALLLIFARRYGWELRQITSYRLLGLVYAFAAFTLLCGLTHAFDAITMWWPYYGIDSVIRVVCALASIVTTVMIWIYGRNYAPDEFSPRRLNQRLIDVAERLERLVTDAK